MKTAIYTLTSALHDEKAIGAQTREFLDSLDPNFELKGDDFSDFGTHTLNLIYVRTGGTEGLFLKMCADLTRRCQHPIYLLTSGKSNSLAASMEILSFLRQQDMEGEIIHGTPEYIAHRIKDLEEVCAIRQRLQGQRLGIIGEPSDWLISSHPYPEAVAHRLGMELVKVPMEELIGEIDKASDTLPEGISAEGREGVKDALPGAAKIYHALRTVVDRYRLQGFTLRCFDLLTAVHNTGCLALALLNSEGIVAGCEGDVPAMVSMAVAQAVTGMTGFQANPASIDPQSGRMVFAHCTIPLNMVQRYEFDTHFESGIGVGIRGYMQQGPVTIFKLSGDLSRMFVAEGVLVENQSKPDLCRTQQVIQLSDPSQTTYFLNNPIGNHHIILPGHHAKILKEFDSFTPPLLKND